MQKATEDKAYNTLRQIGTRPKVFWNGLEPYQSMDVEPDCPSFGASLRLRRKRGTLYPDHEELASCTKYIDNRPGQFGYDSIAKMGLSVGSGKIESTNKPPLA